ncbi:ATP-dependent RNA helicase DbpA [Shewanella yunxiaonensis]|uniref:ATP-dependent RNA helicase DbpA n=1 Tax=Shewanella yunxiaonensis TaxID=2829809 RepID=A0ABX7YRT5_9GAMM|nr:ATP-dependent RNA helicase DbpA [Shewanella yunxiaonensis]QUN05228.1 ATP-dependent RNA helicase DbpA [Shewanella yunxiaonensis]
MTTIATDFASLPLNPSLIATMADLGFAQMTPIQARSLPAILQGRDVLAQAKTGSGKTCAFGLGILQQLDVSRFRVQSLVLCPTRELADQVASELRKFARGIHNIKILTLCGGTPIGPQIGSLEHGAHIIVGTPGRVLEHLQQRRLNLEEVKQWVLDEADRMLEMGFTEALDQIRSYLPKRRQNLLFSATFPEAIVALAKQTLQQPLEVKVEDATDDHQIQQRFYRIANMAERKLAVYQLLLQHRPQSAVVFCNTKQETQDVADFLLGKGFDAVALHGDLDQRQRDQALVAFALKSAVVLVATDVAARGLDIDALDLVINYQLAFEQEAHVHRIGRTGRAGAKGMALSLVAANDGMRLALLEDRYGELTFAELPQVSNTTPLTATMSCVRIEGGKKHKLRPGDILGALTAGNDISGNDVGKIQVHDIWSYVAVTRNLAKAAAAKLSKGKLKGKSFRAWVL